MKSLGKSAAIAGSAFFAAKGLIAGFKKVIDLAAVQELAEKKLEAALGKVSKTLLDQASALQQVSMFGDEQIIEAQALIAAFVKEEDAIAKATKATLDLAAAKGMDLKAAADLVSKTLGSSTNAMSRYGISVEGAVGSTARLDSLVGSVADKFGGQAKAQTETLTGAIVQMDMAMGDLGENIGEAFIEPMTTAALVMKEFALQAQKTNWKSVFSSITIQLKAISPHFAAIANGLDAAGKKIDERNTKDAEKPKKIEEEIQATIFLTEEKQKQITADFNAAQLKIESQKEQLSAHRKMAEFAAQTSASLLTVYRNR